MIDTDPVKNIIINYLTHEITDQEKEQLIYWLEESKENQQQFFYLKDIYQSNSGLPTSDQVEKSWQKMYTLVKTRNLLGYRSKKPVFFTWMKYAAAVIIGIVCATSFLLLTSDRQSSIDTYSTIFTGDGERVSVVLPDGSRIKLNANSSICYPGVFHAKERQVYLEGEAFFEVESDIQKPFIVHTPELHVAATGTSFCVRDYEREMDKTVLLLSGIVQVKDHPGRTTSLSPHQYFTYNTVTSQTWIEEEDIYKYYAWIDNKFVFKSDPLTEVVERLSHHFGVEIILQSEELMNYSYRATFEGESLDQILRLLKLTAPIDYRYAEREQLPDGTFSPNKVIIYETGK